MASLEEQLTTDMKAAMKARDKERLGTVRLLLSAVRYESLAKRRDLTEDEGLSILTREAKRRRESIEAFEKGDRPDLAAQEAAELVIIGEYLPDQLTPDEVREIVKQAISDTGASSKRDFGRVMGAVMPKLKGRFPGKEVKPILDSLLG
jgi:uncharacterized protein YqeY